MDDAVDYALRQRPLDELNMQRLKEANYVFSGFKTFHELKEAFPSLLTEEGQRKPFERFLSDVQQVNERYNSWYLRAEYNFAQSAAQMAATWHRWESDPDRDRYLLQYRTVADKRVRESHRLLHNVTLPIGSRFWDEYFPPNGWNCRCTVVRVRRGKYPESDEAQALLAGSQATTGKHQEMLRFNPGKKMACFPAYNPYTISRCSTCEYNGEADGIKLAAKVPENELCEACKIVRAMNKQYTVIPTERGRLRIHAGHGKNEREENIKIATYFAEKYGYEIDLLDNPQNIPSADSYNRTLQVEQEYKVNNKNSQSAIDNAIRSAARQSSDIVLWIESDISLENILAAMRPRVRRTGKIQSVTLVINGKDIRITREDIIREGFKIQPSDLQ